MEFYSPIPSPPHPHQLNIFCQTHNNYLIAIKERARDRAHTSHTIPKKKTKIGTYFACVAFLLKPESFN